MKRITFVLILSVAVIKGYSQCKDCHEGKHDITKVSQGGTNNDRSSVLPPDSSGGLAQSYILQNVCGLNWEQTSVKVTTRYPTPPGTGLPATVPLTLSACSVDSVVKAFLYFNGSYQTAYAANPASVTITNPAAGVFNYLADSIGTAGEKCWGETGTIAYRVDVTSCINGGGNYTIDLSGTGITAWAIDGITFVVIYVDKSASYSGSIVLWDGLFTTHGPSHSQTFSGFNVCNATSTGQAFSILADMQDNVAPTNTETYNGSTGVFPNSFYNFCTVTTPLTAAQTSTTYSVYTSDGGDCYSWVLAGLYWQNTNCQTCIPTVLATNTVNIVPPHDTICQGDSVQLTASGDSSYIWAPATGLSCTNCPNPKASPNATTTYTVVGYIGCTIGKDTVQVVVEPKGTLSVTPTNANVCPGGHIQLNASGGVNYVWRPSSSLSCSSCANPIASPTVTTTYTVVSGANGCSDSTTVTIIVGAPVPFASTSNPTVCEGASTTLFASNDSAYIWKPSSSLSCTNCATTVATPTATTTYTVIGIAPGGCTDSTTITISVTPTPTLSIVPVNPVICNGGSVVLNASGATNYRWTPAASLSCNNCPNPTASPTITTTYTLIGATSGCRDTLTDTVYVGSTIAAGVKVIPDSVCAGDSVLLIGSGGGRYTWSTGQTNDSIKVAPSATKTYTLVVTNNLCADTIVSTVNILSRITATIKAVNDTVCPHGITSITVTPTAGQVTYKWSNGATTSSINVSDTATTTYTATVYGKCDTVNLFKTVKVVPLPKPIISGTSWKCFGIKDTLTASGGTTYKWGNGSTKSTYYTGPINKDSTIKLIAYNSLGCSDTTYFTITERTKPTIKPIPPAVSCGGSPVILTASATGTGPFSYTWEPGGATTSSITVNDTVQTSYTVIVSNGCPNSIQTKISPDAPTMSACCDKVILVGEDTIIVAGGKDIKTYLWSPNSSLNCDTCATVIATPTVTTTYTVIGTDSLGCQTERLVTITVEIPCFNFTVPNVFTPNNKGTLGLDDVFYIKTTNMNAWSIIIYDRWGKEMYKSTDPNSYWTGTTEGGGNAPDGVYYYIINATCEGTNYKKDGFVQLIR